MATHVRLMIVLALMGALIQALVQETTFDLHDAAPDTVHIYYA